MDPRPGSMVTSTVRLSRPLGLGATGSVWAADHLTLKSAVAVKLLFADVVRRDPTMLQRFNREANVGAQLKSPHVVRIFDYGVVGDQTPFIVMELLEGESLAQRLDRAGPLSVHEVGVIVRQVARALREAHGLGIVHRDIKPENLFLVRHAREPDQLDESFIKVLDFGIAKQSQAVTGLTESEASFGTPRFMSPEQFMSARDVDHQADLWALAAVAYKALTGRPPFEGDTIAAIAMAACRGKFAPPSTLRQDLPAALDRFFARAFDLHVASRFGSASELAAAYHAAVGSDDVSADADAKSVTPVSSPAVARRSGAAWFGVLVGLGVAGAAGAAIVYMALQPDAAPQASAPSSVPEASATVDAQPVVREAPPVAASAEGSSNAVPKAAPVTRAVRTPPPAAPAQPSAAEPNCTPPFTVDANGVRRFKVECL